MAHIGCPVPAEEAEIPLLQRVFTRISTSDSLQAGASNFVSEMREASYILHNLRKDAAALVLFDELGRGTSNRDGASLAWAIIEHVQQFPRTFTLFASHYLQLANLHQLYPNIKCLRMSVKPADRRLHFEYKVQMGVATKSQYMTNFLAEVAGIPASVCRTAKELAARVQFDTVDGSAQRSREEASRNSIAERLLLLKRNSTLSEEDLRLFLLDLQKRLRVEHVGRGPTDKRPPGSGGASTSERHTESRPRTLRESRSSPALSQASILPRLEDDAEIDAAMAMRSPRDREGLGFGHGQHSPAHSIRHSSAHSIRHSPAHSIRHSPPQSLRSPAPEPQRPSSALRQHTPHLPNTPRAEPDNTHMPRRVSLFPSPNGPRAPSPGQTDRDAGAAGDGVQHELPTENDVRSSSRGALDTVPTADAMDVDGDALPSNGDAGEARHATSKPGLGSALKRFLSKAPETAAEEARAAQHDQADAEMHLSNEKASGSQAEHSQRLEMTASSMHVAIGPVSPHGSPDQSQASSPSIALALMALASAQ